MVCAIAASTPGLNSYDVAKALGHNTRRRVAWLARRAISHVNLWCYPTKQPHVYAHAEALLRTGWSPR